MLEARRLAISTPAARDRLPEASQMEQVTDIHIGARLFDAIAFDELCAWLSDFPALATIRLADDWIADEKMAAVQAAFAAALPGVQFEWSYDLLPGGKHGR